MVSTVVMAMVEPRLLPRFDLLLIGCYMMCCHQEGQKLHEGLEVRLIGHCFYKVHFLLKHGGGKGVAGLFEWTVSGRI